MKSQIDLNADLGEGCPWDAELLKRITSANVCCGAHAGDPDSIRETLRVAGELGVVVGAHPGYPDRENFGRVARQISASEARSLVLEQVEALARLAEPLGVAIRYIKPHGAFYNQAQDDAAIATGIVEAAHQRGLPVVGMPDTEIEAATRMRGVRFVCEGFVDRRYLPRGRLMPRTEAEAQLDLPEEILLQVLGMIDALTREEGLPGVAALLRSFNALKMWARVETLCLHGDRPEAVDIADLVRATIRLSRVELRSFV
jgi:UPF0271 protein